MVLVQFDGRLIEARKIGSRGKSMGKERRAGQFFTLIGLALKPIDACREPQEESC
jgi:hypothetical protein